MDPVVLIPIAFPFFFGAMWFGVVGLIGSLGGWGALAARYPAQPDESGHLFAMASASLGRGLLPMNYNGCLKVRLGNAGIGLSVLLPFRFRHPPLTIPWTAVESCQQGWHRLWPGVDLRLRSGERIVLRGRAAKALAETWARYEQLRASPERAAVR